MTERDPDVVDPDGVELDDDPSVEIQYPSHPTLDRALRQIEAGDYRSARATLDGLETDAPSDVRNAAADIRGRIAPDRFALVVFATSVLLVIVVTVLAFTRH